MICLSFWYYVVYETILQALASIHVHPSSDSPFIYVFTTALCLEGAITICA